ncbi:hypothetical protein Tsubulata_042933 [Turnera subulata]|uniref:SET domain-containing protein n=1 Tax=Turnera subulata TaxID=218843 RepID=A0A9Q0EY55_9ROSI|nr:hypothetical protein Tsubulata_042933 [Turnera subulata]
MGCHSQLMDKKEKVLKALETTRALNLPDKEVLDVLKQLWKVFDKKWDLIEAEGYRALVDAFFEKRQRKWSVEGGKQYVRSEDDENERPFKRPNLYGQKNHVSSTMDNQRKKLTLKDEDDLSVTTLGHRVRDSTQLLTKNEGGQRPESSPLPSFTLGSTSGMCCDRSSVIASSTSGEVQLSLKYNAAIRQSNFRTPNFNAVMKFLEDKYLKMRKIVTPEFSVKALLKDLCDSYVKIGTVSHNSSSEGRTVGKSLHLSGDNNPNMARKASKSSGKRTVACSQKRSFHKVNDIAKGTENVKISLTDEFGREELPTFTYMPRNMIYQNAYVQISLARISDEDFCSDCSGDCLSCDIPCECARETGGEFAYTREGLLKEEFLAACVDMKKSPEEHHLFYCEDCPIERSKNEYLPDDCKGHLIRKFIKECWIKCGCSMECGNRIVQRGITSNLQVFLSGEGKGWGVRTLQELRKGTFVCEYVGEILTNTELYERNIQNSDSNRHTYPVTLDADWGSERILKDEEALCLDATFSGNVARCYDANLIDIPIQVETPDRHYYHLAFFTTRQVNALEELSWDYGIDFNDVDHPIKAFKCSCGSEWCRDVKQKAVGNC